MSHDVSWCLLESIDMSSNDPIVEVLKNHFMDCCFHLYLPVLALSLTPVNGL